MKGEGPDSCAVLTATTSGHPLSGVTGAMEDHPTSIQVSISLYISMEDGGMDPGYSSVHKYGEWRDKPWTLLCT
jgi:hypothetical protein